MADITKDSVILSAFFTESEMKDCVNRSGIFYVLSGRNEGDLGKSYTADKTGIVMQSFNEDLQPIMLKYEIYDKAKLLEMAEYKLDYYNYEH